MTPTERFIEALSELLPQMTDVQRVRLEDAFNDAVQEQIRQDYPRVPLDPFPWGRVL